jgi:hypothetical protein
MTKIPLRKESIVYIIILGLITLITYFFLPLIAITTFILLLFIIYFFKDSIRTIEINDKVLISPRDCTVMYIKYINNKNYQEEKGDTVRDGRTVIGVVK